MAKSGVKTRAAKRLKQSVADRCLEKSGSKDLDLNESQDKDRGEAGYRELIFDPLVCRLTWPRDNQRGHQHGLRKIENRFELKRQSSTC